MPDLTKTQVIEYLKSLDEIEFIDLFYQSVGETKVEGDYEKSHWIIGEVSSFAPDWNEREFTVFNLPNYQCYHEQDREKPSIKDYIFREACQSGVCINCDTLGGSWMKHQVCSFCKEETYGT